MILPEAFQNDQTFQVGESYPACAFKDFLFSPEVGHRFCKYLRKNRLLNNDMSSTYSRHQGRSEERQVILQGCTAFLCQSQPPSTPTQLCLVWVRGQLRFPCTLRASNPKTRVRMCMVVA